MKVAIIGAGIAGAAAAFEVARQGGPRHRLSRPHGLERLVLRRARLRALGSGRSGQRARGDLVEFSKQLGAWELGSAARRLATLEGNVRPARGSDSALLDLEQCAGKRVAVIDLERDDWDAPLLAKSFASSAWAVQTGTHFFAARAQVLQTGFERRISGYDFALLHDAPERALALQKALRESGVSVDAWLFGPWLGIERPLARELSLALGVPVGETTSAPGGAAGARFEQARDRLLVRIANVARGHLISIERDESGYRLQLRERAPEQFPIVGFGNGRGRGRRRSARAIIRTARRYGVSLVLQRTAGARARCGSGRRRLFFG